MLRSTSARARHIDRTFRISRLIREPDGTEIVERKGMGHPDTICDMLAENLSRGLSRHYLEHFGTILHHNVDKALLRGGRAQARFGGGTVEEPIDIYLCGRAVANARGHSIPIEDIANETAFDWLSAHLHALDVRSNVRIHNLVREGSTELVGLFEHGAECPVPRANDTSIGVGYAPLSALETAVLKTEKHLNRRIRSGRCPAWGEDIKIMGARSADRVSITVACALIGRHLADIASYQDEKDTLRRAVTEAIERYCDTEPQVEINAADDVASGSIYLTVTGTSAEAGDDGEVGRGNRANGLITPKRPMSLEALAGKNPVSHVGKLYNVAAHRIAQSLISECADIAAAECYLLSRIGLPITEPAIVDIRLATKDGRPLSEVAAYVEDIAHHHIHNIPRITQEFIDGRIDVA